MVLIYFDRCLCCQVSQIEERLKDMGKAWKRNSAKMEDNSKNVMDRIGEMTLGVQVSTFSLSKIFCKNCS